MMSLLWRLRLPLLAGLIAILLVELAISSIRIHYRELEILLQRNAYLENGEGQTHLAAKFITQLKLYRHEITRAQADEQEFDLNNAMRQKKGSHGELVMSKNIVDRLNVVLINGMRTILHQPLLPYERDVPMLEDLSAAFKLERIKEYGSAMIVYNKVLQEFPNFDLRLKSLIELHQGFCYAILGDYPRAKEKLVSVINAQENSDLGVTSSILLEYLNIMEKEKNRVTGTDLERAQKYTDLLHCDEALQILNQIPIQNKEEFAEINLLKGRCLEEVGTKSAAIHSYLSAVQAGKNSTFGKEANRRIYIVGAQVEGDRKIQKIAEKINTQVQDSVIQKFQEAAPQSSSSPSQDTLNSTSIRMSPDEEALITQQAQSIEDTLASMAIKDSGQTHSSHFPSLPSFGTHARFNLAGGKTISGEVMSLPGESVVRVKTMIGVIGIARKDIRSIEFE